MAKTNTSVDYKDERFTEVTSDKNAALKEANKTYDQMITDSDKYYQAQVDAVTKYGDKQTQLQQEQTDFAIEKIEQQKEQAHKDYLKEQSASYVDYQKQSNQYGTNAEKQAEMGLAHTGYSESSQVSMWNTYQNRYAMARDVYNRAVLDYDNAIKEARLQNSSVLAEIAFNTLQTRLQLALQGFQYKNTLILEKANKKAEIEDRYHARWQDVLAQINTENALAFQKEQFEWQKKKSNVSYSGSNDTKGGIKLSGKDDEIYTEALNIYKKYGEDGLTEFFDKHPDCDRASIMEYCVANESSGAEAKAGTEAETKEKIKPIGTTKTKVSERTWEVSWLGGDNGFWGLNENATLIDENGNKMEAKALRKALMEEGMTKDDANKFIDNIDDRLYQHMFST